MTGAFPPPDLPEPKPRTAADVIEGARNHAAEESHYVRAFLDGRAYEIWWRCSDCPAGDTSKPSL